MPDELSVEQQSDVDQLSDTHRSNTEDTSVELQGKVEQSTLQQQFESKQPAKRQNEIGKTLEEISDKRQAVMQENNDQLSETHRSNTEHSLKLIDPSLLMSNKNKHNLIRKISSVIYRNTQTITFH